MLFSNFAVTLKLVSIKKVIGVRLNHVIIKSIRCLQCADTKHTNKWGEKKKGGGRGGRKKKQKKKEQKPNQAEHKTYDTNKFHT